ncbi:MAG: circularly permuted type 2 ATP-grasp protein [Steroidobacteraceae bacterium]
MLDSGAGGKVRAGPYNEMLDGDGAARAHCAAYCSWLSAQPAERLAQKRAEADALFHRLGITFAVYGENAGTERLIPFDIVPRIIPADEWTRLEAGLKQRVRALNAFIWDVYHDQNILRAGVVPPERVLCNLQYRPEMQGVDVPSGIYAHIAGIDVVRDADGSFCVLEDNLRVPSGVSYMLENRKMMMRLFPELFAHHAVEPVEQYPDLLLENLKSVAPAAVADPTVVLLTPGMYNSAYFEHAFLAQQMGIELVEGQDLFVLEDVLYMRTTRGPVRVDVVYRRIDDDFLDPLSFRPDSSLGVAGLLTVYRAGHVTIANAIGTGVADDKSIYPYVPEMVRFYLSEEPLLGNVRTWILANPGDRAYVLDHLPELVVKEVHGAGGYGMLIGPAATRAQLEEFRARIRAHPERYIAQPTLALSTSPTFANSGIVPRHIDLRPFVLSGRSMSVVPGGLTRVALREGSLIVNSSQGGGTKDTWVLER